MLCSASVRDCFPEADGSVVVCLAVFRCVRDGFPETDGSVVVCLAVFR